MRKLLSRKKIVVTLAILGFLGGIVWSQHKPLLARYYVQSLAQLVEGDRESWAASVVALDEAAVPFLLARLQDGDGKTCANLECALVGLIQKWGPDDARSSALMEQVTALPVEVVAARLTALHLAGVLAERAPSGPWLRRCRELVDEGLDATDADTRLAAVQLVLRPPLRKEMDLLARLVPLLKDSVAPVRKTALLALGSARDLVSDDDLVPLLHDFDEEVQSLCELTLRSRGLPDSHILLARLISDERPNVRLNVLSHLREATDLEPAVWLRRLCQDPVPAVRAAAVRAVFFQSQVELCDCLQAMAQEDPSPTVRQLAGHYLQRAHRNAGE